MNESFRVLGILAKLHGGKFHGDSITGDHVEYDIEFPNAHSATSFCEADFRELVPNFEHYQLRDPIIILSSPVVVIVRCWA